MTRKREVHASVKDQRLIEKRRDQMVKGAVTLIKKKGFHRTTTREIAKSSGFSIGTLYEYIKTKEDVLYLVCDSIYDQVRGRLEKVICKENYSIDNLKQAIENYFKVVDEMQDEVLVMYQEVKSLSKDALPYVLKKEVEMVTIFEEIIAGCVKNGYMDLEEKEVELLAHHIFVQGQMWAFRRWSLQKLYSLEEYTTMQTKFLLQGFSIERQI
ncbi:TetR/AcrR family transcriptional regulator [Priestia koreensis]|uniref:TetR family transcriptional regulator n=1 Tax=Priestia koreensis TaxID=284581 RepID=A0A0M0KEN3_9BACI|nr:TetR/AcrR family transcriptional regulator [Priestia koreensis]KOO37306.1 TetR family transcriptional regulator [Priestia koreensis]MCM3006598.1 TetR/AcrR family transcriptional regulator [Priestia koreensis]UNL84903.1 TetR/AcrR family transcriptional regulator [Priestia koreensis]